MPTKKKASKPVNKVVKDTKLSKKLVEKDLPKAFSNSLTVEEIMNNSDLDKKTIKKHKSEWLKTHK